MIHGLKPVKHRTWQRSHADKDWGFKTTAAEGVTGRFFRRVWVWVWVWTYHRTVELKCLKLQVSWSGVLLPCRLVVHFLPAAFHAGRTRMRSFLIGGIVRRRPHPFLPSFLPPYPLVHLPTLTPLSSCITAGLRCGVPAENDGSNRERVIPSAGCAFSKRKAGFG